MATNLPSSLLQTFKKATLISVAARVNPFRADVRTSQPSLAPVSASSVADIAEPGVGVVSTTDCSRSSGALLYLFLPSFFLKREEIRSKNQGEGRQPRTEAKVKPWNLTQKCSAFCRDTMGEGSPDVTIVGFDAGEAGGSRRDRFGGFGMRKGEGLEGFVCVWMGKLHVALHRLEERLILNMQVLHLD